MNNKKLIRLPESFLVLPMLTMLMPFGAIPGNINNNLVMAPQTVLSQKQNIVALSLPALNQADDEKAKTLQNQADDEKAKTLQNQADAIDAYFKGHNMPLEGKGMKMAEEADENGLDYRLLPGIAAIESTGGRQACKNVTHSFMGWGSCKINFKSDDEGIEVVAKNLGGNNPSTEKHYDGKTIKQILEAYNPPSVVPNYAKRVMKEMNEIGDNPVKAKDVTSVLNT